MSAKELKHLNRRELLQMLLLQAEENERLKEELARTKALLEKRSIMLDEAGSIAEASLRLHEIFSAAQAAADTYLENIRALEARQKERCVRQEAEALGVGDLWKEQNET